MIDPDYLAAFADYVTDEDFDAELLALDVELSCYAPPGYSLLDEEELLTRVAILGYIEGVKLA